MAKLKQELDGLLLTLEVVGDEALPGSDASHFAARIRNTSGTTILELRLPAAMVESSVIGRLQHELTMSPDGMIWVLYDSIDAEIGPPATFPIDTLVEKSLTTAMIEDEPNAAVALDTLRHRLKRALLAVDAAQAQLK